jgi:hypothetical protein
LAHFQERHQEGERGFGALILIGAIGMQAIAASAGGGIVERDLQIVVAEEPIECAPRFLAPAILSRDAIGLQAGGDGGAGFDGLLIEAGLLGTLRIEAVRSDRDEVALCSGAMYR